MNDPELGDESHGTLPELAGRVSGVVHVFPVAIGRYTNFPDLDAEAQAGRLLDLLAPFGARHHEWAAPTLERGAGAVERRLREWAEAGGAADTPNNTVLYWVGHGWSDGTHASLAHADSPARVGAAGVTPEQFADVIRIRQALAQVRVGSRAKVRGWALVVVDTCRSRRFAELLAAALKAHDPPDGVLLIGVSGEGATTLGRFTDALRTALTTTYKANRRIGLTELTDQFHRLLPGCEVCSLGDLTDAALVPVYPPVASWMSAPLDTIRHLEDILEDLSSDERRHFLVKAQGAEHGELSWFFEGRDQERARIVSWLRHRRSGMLVVTGRAGSGKSALLGDVLVRSRPDLRDALARRGLITALASHDMPPDDVFDCVIHLSGLTIPQVTHRLAAAARLGPLPPRTDPAAGIATDLDWLAARLAERTEPFTILADALDEAIDPLDTARSLLARISALPGVRVLVGTRTSTNETPDAPAEDVRILDALAAAPAGPTQPAPSATSGRDTSAGKDLSGPVWIVRDPDAINRYVARRLRAAHHHGVAGKAVQGMNIVTDADIDRAAALVASRDREFLFARLAVYELIEDPRLLTPGLAGSLSTLLEGDHQDLFAKALDRLAHRDDRFAILLQALSLARGRGLPEADGIWAAIAAALSPEILQSRTLTMTDPMDSMDGGAKWAQAIHALLGQAAAYIIADNLSGDLQDTVGSYRGNGDTTDDAGSGTVYRLAHRTFVEYFTTHGRATQRDRRRRAAAALLHAASQAAAADPGNMPAYLARHLSGHAAEAGMWDNLADRPLVLDGLDPDAVTADAVRTLFGRRAVPPPVAGVIGARDALATASPSDRAGLRQLATTTHSSQHVIDEPTISWGIAAAQSGQVTMHVRLTGHTATVCKVCSLTLPDGRTALASASDDGTIRLWDPATATPIGTPLTGHSGTVENICVLAEPSGRTLLVSTGSDGTVRIWDPATGQQVTGPLTGHTGRVRGVCTLPGHDAHGHPDGRVLLATTGDDATVRIWNPATGEQASTPLTGHTGAVWGVCTLPGHDAHGHPDGRILLATTGNDATVRIWDPATGEQASTPLIGHTGVSLGLCTLPGRDADGHPDGRVLLATTGSDGTVRIWDPATGQQTSTPLTGHTGGVWGVCTLPGRDAHGHPDGRTLLATTGNDGTVRIWDPATGLQASTPLTGHTGTVLGVCTLPGQDVGRRDRRILLATTGDDATVRIWDPATARQVTGQLTGHTGRIRGVCALPDRDADGHRDGRALLATTGDDGTVRIWDPATGRQTSRPLTGHAGAVLGLCTLPGSDADGHRDGRVLLATTGYDGTVRIWDPATGQQTSRPLTGHAGAVWGVCTLPGSDADGHPDGQVLLATTGDDGTIRIWDLATGQQATEPLTGHAGRVRGVCTLPGPDVGRRDRQVLLATTGDDGTVRIWDPATGQQAIGPWRGHTGAVLGVCTLPGSLANGHRDGRVLLATTGYDGTVRIWDPATGQQATEPLTGHTGTIVGVCTLPGYDARGHPDGRVLVATTGDDGTVRIWDPATGQQATEPLTGHTGGVWGVCTLPGQDTGYQDGRVLLATTGDDGTVRIWDPATGRAVGEPLAGSPDTFECLARCAALGADCISVGGDDALRIWTAATASFAAVSSAWHASAVAMSAYLDHDVLLTGDTAGLVHVTEIATGRILRAPVRTGNGAVLALCPLPGEPARVAAGGRGGTIAIFALTSPQVAEPALQAHSGPVRDLCLIEKPGHRPLLASAGNDATIRIWDLDTQAPRGGPLTGHDGWIWSITSIPAHADKAPLLASAGADATVRLWDSLSGQQLGQPLEGHTDQVRAVICAIADNGRVLLISGGHDGTVRLWHPYTGAPVYTIPLKIPVHALLQREPDRRSVERTDGGATIIVGLRTGVLALDLHSSLFLSRDETT